MSRPKYVSSYSDRGVTYTPDENGTFVAFWITVQAKEAGFSYSGSDFYMRGPSGNNNYSMHWETTLSNHETLAYGTLQKGETASGYLSFDAPKHGTLVYDFSSFVPVGEAIGEWSY